MNGYITPEMVSMAVTMVIIPILGFITKYIIIFLKCKITELEQRVDNDTLGKYISIAEDAIETAVISVNQTFVDALKKQETFDQTAMEKSFSAAKCKALSIMGTSAQKALNEAYEDVDAWLDSKIEFYVNQNKK